MKTKAECIERTNLLTWIRIIWIEMETDTLLDQKYGFGAVRQPNFGDKFRRRHGPIRPNRRDYPRRTCHLPGQE